MAVPEPKRHHNDGGRMLTRMQNSPPVMRRIAPMILSVWCLIIAALWPGAAFANDGVTPINVATLERAVKVSDYGSYLTDVTLPWHTSIEEDSQIFDQSVDLPALIALAADGQFQPITTRHSAHNGAHDTIIHVRIPLTNPSAEAQSFIPVSYTHLTLPTICSV